MLFIAEVQDDLFCFNPLSLGAKYEFKYVMKICLNRMISGLWGLLWPVLQAVTILLAMVRKINLAIKIKAKVSSFTLVSLSGWVALQKIKFVISQKVSCVLFGVHLIILGHQLCP